MTTERRDRWVTVAVLLGLSALLAVTHGARVDEPARAYKVHWHELVVANQAPDPYQYKMWLVTWAVEGAHRATGISVTDLYLINVVLGLTALVFAHHAFLSRLYGRKIALAGAFLLAAYCNGLFRDYQHHPYDFWGVTLYCLLLAAVVAGKRPLFLAGASLATGVLWDKHALVPALAAGRRWRHGETFLHAAVWAVVGVLASVAIPVAIRLFLGTDRRVVDVTPLDEQLWHRVLWNHVPLLGPALLCLLLAWKRLPDWVRWLWWTVPVVFAAYLLSKFMIHELRSFWVFIPIYTATICGWLATLRTEDPSTPSPGSSGGS